MKHNVLKRIAQIFLMLSRCHSSILCIAPFGSAVKNAVSLVGTDYFAFADCFGCGGSAVLLVDCGARY